MIYKTLLFVFLSLMSSVAFADLRQLVHDIGQYDQVSGNRCNLDLNFEKLDVDFIDEVGNLEQLSFLPEEIEVGESLGWTSVTQKSFAKQQTLRLLRRGSKLLIAAVYSEKEASKRWSCQIDLLNLNHTVAFFERSPTWGEWLDDNSGALLAGAFAGAPNVESVKRSIHYDIFSKP